MITKAIRLHEIDHEKDLIIHLDKAYEVFKTPEPHEDINLTPIDGGVPFTLEGRATVGIISKEAYEESIQVKLGNLEEAVAKEGTVDNKSNAYSMPDKTSASIALDALKAQQAAKKA